LIQIVIAELKEPVDEDTPSGRGSEVEDLVRVGKNESGEHLDYAQSKESKRLLHSVRRERDPILSEVDVRLEGALGDRLGGVLKGQA